MFSPHSEDNIEAFAEILRPFGEITAIDEPEGLDLLPLKTKRIAWHWEFMFTRPMFETPDMIEQKHLLSRVAELVDERRIRTTADPDDRGLLGRRPAAGARAGRVRAHDRQGRRAPLAPGPPPAGPGARVRGGVIIRSRMRAGWAA